MKRMFPWLDATKKDMQKQIRNLEIELQRHEAVSVEEYSYFNDDLHPLVSDNVTVIYRLVAARPMAGVAVLWALSKAFYGRDPMLMPRSEYPAWAVAIDYESSKYNDGPGHLCRSSRGSEAVFWGAELDIRAWRGVV